MHKIINADIFVALKSIPDNSIDVAITSPPYWSQRNYGFDNQVGNECSYIKFISRLTFLFDILKEKLTDEGVFFLNIGDKYLKKYGKTPLGLIPYKLAYFMQKNGWIINDTIIWYKPNHMPSSVKNRFVNSYEPIFVLSKKKENYFTNWIKENPEYSNILKINLQPTSYNHIATYPEKLVSSLLNLVKIEKEYTVLDPFAGSGTTLKVINDINKSMFTQHKASGIMIEFNSDYIEIIKQRTGLKNINIKKYPFEEYDYQIFEEKFSIDFENIKELTKINTLNIAKNKSEFYSILKTILNKKYIKLFPHQELLFIGLENFSVEDIYNISQINQKAWIIRNQLVIKKNNKWFPVFMLVQDNKTCRYYFNYKRLKFNHKSKETKTDLCGQNFVGYNVVDNISKNKKQGLIISVIEKYDDGLPKYVKVFWDNDKIITKEFVKKDDEEVMKNLNFTHNNGYIFVKELKNYISLEKIINTNIEKVKLPKKSISNRNYNGKFKEIERKNWGASPGARSSVEEEYFSLQRLYPVKQEIIADYLNYIRKQQELSKNVFIELFPKNYKHTVGHWLRKDFGGSVPVPSDWNKIEKLFDIDKNMTNYVCKTALKLQTVKNTKYKIPDDLISNEMIGKLLELNKE